MLLSAFNESEQVLTLGSSVLINAFDTFNIIYESELAFRLSDFFYRHY